MRLAVWSLLGGLVIFAAPASAEPPKFQTRFTFQVKFGDGTQTYNENQHMTVQVAINPAFGWQCERPPPIVVDGRLRGGFTCSNDGFKTNVYTMIGCKAGELDSTRTAAMRIFSARPDGKPQGAPVPDAGAPDGGPNPVFGMFIDLAVTCETVRS